MTEIELLTLTAAILLAGQYRNNVQAAVKEASDIRRAAAGTMGVEKEPLDYTVSELPFNVRAFNSLSDCGFKTVREIVAVGRTALSHKKHIGPKQIKHIEEVLSQIGVSFL